MTASEAALMRHNLTLCERQMLELADKAKSLADAADFVRGAAIYRRIREGLDTERGSGLLSPHR